MTNIAYIAGYLASLAGQPRCWNPWLCGGPERVAWALGHYDACEDARPRVLVLRFEPEVVAVKERTR